MCGLCCYVLDDAFTGVDLIKKLKTMIFTKNMLKRVVLTSCLEERTWKIFLRNNMVFNNLVNIV
ncbi:hypothetical protein Hanom_Chr01g00000551 [Helianthus anomalus]